MARCNNEPPGTGNVSPGVGESAGFEGMHKSWQVTGDEDLRRFAMSVMETFIEKGHISFHSHGRFIDLYALYAAHDMLKDPKWIDLARSSCPLRPPDRTGTATSIRRIIHFLGWCHELGLIDDSRRA